MTEKENRSNSEIVSFSAICDLIVSCTTIYATPLRFDVNQRTIPYYSAMLCVSAVFAVARGVCLSVCHVGVLYPDG